MILSSNCGRSQRQGAYLQGPNASLAQLPRPLNSIPCYVFAALRSRKRHGEVSPIVPSAFQALSHQSCPLDLIAWQKFLKEKPGARQDLQTSGEDWL